MIVTATVLVHKFSSVAVNVYTPAAKPVAAGVTVITPVPPDVVNIAEPVLPPLHFTFNWLATAILTPAAGSVTATEDVAVHAPNAVTITV